MAADCIAQILTGVSEYQTGMIRSTFTAVPRRRALFTARAIVTTLVMTVLGLLVSALSFVLTQARPAVIRRTALTVVAICSLLILAPASLSEKSHSQAMLAHTMPLFAWDRLAKVVPTGVVIPYPWTVTGAWTVMALWALGESGIGDRGRQVPRSVS